MPSSLGVLWIGAMISLSFFLSISLIVPSINRVCVKYLDVYRKAALSKFLWRASLLLSGPVFAG